MFTKDCKKSKNYSLFITINNTINLEQVFIGFSYAVYRIEDLSTADLLLCYKKLVEFK